MKLFTRISALACVLSLLLILSAAASPPTLKEIDNAQLPAGEISPGASLTFNLRYSGDPPTSLLLVVQTPDGDTVQVPAAPPAGDPSQGVDVSWVYKPLNSGPYHYHFEAAAGDLGSVRFPSDSSADYTFDSVNVGLKWITFAVGAAAALLLLPFVLYNAIRVVRKSSDAAGTARAAIFIGIVALYALFITLFLPIYHVLGAAIGGAATVALIVGLFSRR